VVVVVVVVVVAGIEGKVETEGAEQDEKMEKEEVREIEGTEVMDEEEIHVREKGRETGKAHSVCERTVKISGLRASSLLDSLRTLQLRVIAL
jgi:hypothetical protein